MRFLDKPLIPPGCPTEKKNYVSDLSDTRRFPLTFIVRNCDLDRDCQYTNTEIFAYFGVPDDNHDHPYPVATSDIVVPANSDLAQKAGRIANMSTSLDDKASSSNDNPRVERIRQAFCERVANCQGIVNNGECWALGAAAVIEVVQQVPLED